MKGIPPRLRMLSLRHKARTRALSDPQTRREKTMPELRQRLSSLGRAVLWIAAAVQLASLAACGGGGGYGGGGGNMPTGGAPSKLFAADSPDMAIGSLANADPGTGAF